MHEGNSEHKKAKTNILPGAVVVVLVVVVVVVVGPDVAVVVIAAVPETRNNTKRGGCSCGVRGKEQVVLVVEVMMMKAPYSFSEAAGETLPFFDATMKTRFQPESRCFKSHRDSV